MARTGRPNIIRAAVLREVQTSLAPLGISHNAVMAATGLSARKVSGALSGMARTGLIFAVELNKFGRYFATAQQRDAAKPEVIAGHRREVLANLRKNEAKGNARKREQYAADASVRAAAKARVTAQRAKKASAPARPERAAEPKPQHVRPVVTAAAKPATKRADLPAVIPEGLQKQVIPGCPTRTRFQPEPGFIGDWRRLGVGRYLEQAA